MENDTQKGFETIGDAARRLLDRIEARKKTASEGCIASDQIEERGRGFDLRRSDFPCPDAPVRNTDADPNRDVFTIPGKAKATRAGKLKSRLPRPVYVTWGGNFVVAANGNQHQTGSRCFEG